MKAQKDKCTVFSHTLTVGNKVYDTFEDRISYFNSHYTDNDLITCALYVNHKYVEQLARYMISRADYFKDAVDLFGFSALHYLYFSQLNRENIEEMIRIGFVESLPNRILYKHYNNHSYYFSENNVNTCLFYLGYEGNNHPNYGALDVGAGVHNFLSSGCNLILIDGRKERIPFQEVINAVKIHNLDNISILMINAHGVATDSGMLHLIDMDGYSTNSIENPSIYFPNQIDSTYFIENLIKATGDPNSSKAVLIASCESEVSGLRVAKILPTGSIGLVVGEYHTLHKLDDTFTPDVVK